MDIGKEMQELLSTSEVGLDNFIIVLHQTQTGWLHVQEILHV